MKVAVEFRGYVGVLTKERRIEVELEGDKVKDLMTALNKRFPFLAGYNERGFKMVINHRIITTQNWNDTRLTEGDEVALYTFVGGG